jgi:hypothetical protein
VDWAASALPVEGEQTRTPRAGDVLRADVPRCRMDERVRAARERARQAGWDRVVVVDDAGVVLGIVAGDALIRETDGVVESVMDADPRTIRPSVALADVGDAALVTTPDGVLLGALP